MAKKPHFPAPPKHVEESKDSKDILIAHLTTLWESERENAERISRRMDLLGGGMVAMLGLGFFSTDWLYEDPSQSLLIWPHVTVWIFHVVLMAIVIVFARALAVLYFSKSSGRTATELLEISAADIGTPTRRTVIRKLSRAYNYLKLRNEAARSRLQHGERWFAVGLALLLITLLLYLVLTAPRKASPEEVNRGTDIHFTNE